LGGESSKTIKRMAMSSAGSQLTLWRMRSALLYYRKHHGAMGAWLASGTETLWHTLRALKHAGATDAAQQAKAEESKTLVTLMRQAWRETQGGMISPARPW
jgi:hypothetical protein